VAIDLSAILEAIHKNFQSLRTHRASAGIRVLRDHCTGLAGFHGFGHFGQFGAPTGIAKEFVNVFNAHSGNNTLRADVSELFDQVLQEGYLEIIAGAELCVSAFAGPDVVTVSIPKQAGLAKSCAR
jgi:L-amino acid N-acyltransferase YncA